MKQVNTKYGTIYIEDLEYDRHRPNWREEEDRIKIFDSDKNYMDCWHMDTLEDFARTENKTLEEVYQDIIRRYEDAEYLDEICPDVRFDTDDIEKFVLFMKVDGYLDIENQDLIFDIFHNPDKLREHIKGHEWVNRIGNHYLLIEEY